MTKYEGQTIRVVTAEIRRGGRYLLTQRLPTATLPLLWEFPGGKVAPGRAPQDVLAALLRDRVGVDVEVGELVLQVVHEYERYVVDMQVYRCEVPADQDPRPLRVHDARWVSPAEFGQYAFPGADEATIATLLELDPKGARDAEP